MSFLKLAPWTVKRAVAHELNTLGQSKKPFLLCRLLVGYCKHLC